MENLKEKIEKKWYKSKTVIFNSFVALSSAIVPVLQENLDFIKQIKPEYYLYFVIFLAVINLILRSVTSKKIKK